MAEISEEFKTKMSEWVQLKQQLVDVRKDMKILTTREKELNTYIKNYMRVQKLDTVNMRQGKVKYKAASRKPTLTKKAVEEGLFEYYQGDENKVKEIMDYITNRLEPKETQSISLTGIKKNPAD